MIFTEYERYGIENVCRYFYRILGTHIEMLFREKCNEEIAGNVYVKIP